MENWLNFSGGNKDIVLSSRIRLARNIKDISFPHKLKEDEGRDVVNKVEEAFYTSIHTEEDYKTLYLWQMDDINNRAYLEKHLISNKLITNNKKSAFILNKDETVSIMINEEDHLRLQCITSGMNLEEAYDSADKIDNFLEEKLDYAYDEKLGYLTACPTNIGTGLRASVMIHLPALSMNNEMNGVLKVLTQVGMTIRGLYGEGSISRGNIYQISNQITLGLSEKEIIDNLKAVVGEIINQENLCRQKLISNYKYELEDKIYRSLGILKSAVLLETGECLNFLSDVRFGIEMGIINEVNKEILNSLIVDVQPAMLQKSYNDKFTDNLRNLNRAKLVRERLAKTNN
ncbi:protein arginine kinase [Clostridium tetanomorphum]|uniref:Protein-arginine kinase n=1 Tax=Clostridium tetanomorphum TaxID=1553 RepID=A0A923J275_CLOTT|nr:protein arginine kinase [Clostridium tetanomorphum]KAJ52207.1 ATP:guanido phosphotransferase [Clostridium tetanomorphum DSM 665]MBC2399986.1 protein arginine kinase [Clostridium tetanomorphum]MBP1863802.1 protein arginine kinase [Clostridium tetanomorphum]NRS86378.1 protein arginine kinase [Clostridium tetanomorphum]NRZ95592.1 protein arginine kinase [Clostridium tetanomorphum]